MFGVVSRPIPLDWLFRSENVLIQFVCFGRQHTRVLACFVFVSMLPPLSLTFYLLYSLRSINSSTSYPWTSEQPRMEEIQNIRELMLQSVRCTCFRCSIKSIQSHEFNWILIFFLPFACRVEQRKNARSHPIFADGKCLWCTLSVYRRSHFLRA